ncbi:Polyketide cyclase / dehydrase and lipid transport [Seminavis robusta]|uniref:Polyketide cyclase / dehydrase and lipid transport n=1 Tax=Seminavis robusta TaxID=568900 RepID=A0A9N8DK98_9STRA|nr:Polyketide cyclase / dehydrase and lipid transport [Seminavis robusta]|eukprot:Sro201_g084930.1 Polyketide cyclase / dehydrase and lipid transport (165) ;mRNA; f:6903-7539
MGTFQVETIIDAPIAAVWDRLAGDIGSIAEWNPGVQESYVLDGAKKTGLGAQRHCDLGNGNHLEEEVVKFEPETAITFRITNSNMPFARADIRFSLASVETGHNNSGSSTKVIVSPDYQLKYGCIGEFLDWSMVKRTYKKGMKNLLGGLKKDVEANQQLQSFFQ